jgi:hypothetical protein
MGLRSPYTSATKFLKFVHTGFSKILGMRNSQSKHSEERNSDMLQELLPQEILLYILSFLQPSDLKAVSLVAHSWKQLAEVIRFQDQFYFSNLIDEKLRMIRFGRATAIPI